MVSEVLNLNNEFLSQRETNRAKRKAKQMYSKQFSEECYANSSSHDIAEQINDVDVIEDKRLKIDDSKDISTAIQVFDEVISLLIGRFSISFHILNIFKFHPTYRNHTGRSKCLV